MNDFGNRSSVPYTDPTIVVTVMPDATPDWIALEVGQAGDVMREVSFVRGFEVEDHGMVECWLVAADRPAISPLHERYRLLRRSDPMERTHHMTDPRRPNVEERLRQTSMISPNSTWSSTTTTTRSPRTACSGTTR